MSYVVATPDFLRTAAQSVAAMGSAVSAANAAAASSTTSLLTAAADEVSTGIAALFSAHGSAYQSISAQAADFHERFVQTLAATANAYRSAELANATTTAAAGTRITIPGAGPLYQPNFLTRLPYLGQKFLEGGVAGPSTVSILQGYDLLNHAIGQNWFPNTIAQVVNYPASIGIFSGSLAAPGANDAIAMGQRALNDQITNAVVNGNGSPVHIAGLSQGTIVVNRELAYLATAPDAPPAHALQFAMFSSPELGLAHIYLPKGATVPLIDYTVQPLAHTQYDVSVVFGQYDFWGNPPDRPWNLLAVANSLFGAAYYHDPVALLSPSDMVQLSSVTDPLGGTITTYMLPSATLPMLLPLKQIGVAAPIVDHLNSVLQPMVNAGYSSLTPDAGPYFSGGSLIGLPSWWQSLVPAVQWPAEI